MARIYIARTTGIGSFERHVVLKLITPERANDHTAVQMFLDEARLAASLNHQNVAQVFEVGEDGGIHYLAMEYVHGQDLRALLAKAGSQGTRVPLELALTTVAGAAAGLNHAHERRDGNGVPLGIVHRDVSPSNIMIGLDGSVKLLDFGIAKATARSVETVSGIIKGKFAYMAPEQCRGRDVDRRSDVFSLGIILYEITTQHRCFRADSDFDTMHRIVTGDVVRPTRLVQGYPQALEAIVMKALAVDANQRYQSAGLLLEAIESFAVSSRMSLSTMALGRFMREMFGETPEPWLTGARGNGTMPPKESTISNTNGQSEGHAHLAQRTSAVMPTAAQQVAAAVVASAQSAQAARTLLDLPRDHEERDDEGEPDAAEWNAKSYPTMVPGSYASTATLPPGGELKVGRTSSPQLPVVTAPVASSPAIAVPPAARNTPPNLSPAAAANAASLTGARAALDNAQFPAQPGSGSHRSHPALPAITYKQGTNQSGQSYGLTDESLSDVRVRPNRRPLWIGLFIIAIGVGVVLFVGYGGGNDIVPAPSDPKPAPEPKQPIVDNTEKQPVATPDAGPADDLVVLELTSKPSGAEVYLAGKLLGTTPFKQDRPRGNGDVSVVLKHPGFENMTLKVDTTGDYGKDVVLIAEKPEVKPEVKPPEKPPIVNKPPEKPPVVNKPPIKPPVKPDKPPVKPDKPPTPVKQDCQIPGQAMPFDPRPVCKS
jgi:serine/threonine protein kinase